MRMLGRGAVVAALVLTGCGVSKEEFAAAQRDAANNKKMYQDEAQKSAALEKKVADLQAQNAALNTSTTQLTQEKGELQAKSQQYEQLAGSLKQQIDSGQVELSELKGKMTVKLKDRVVFSSGSTAINKQGRDALDAVAKAFQGLQGKNVIVAGYTDNVPTGKRGGFKDNWDLSAARAVTVVRYLQSQGVDAKILGAAGFSEYRPLASNDTAEGKSQNRRIEIALTAADYTPPTVDLPPQTPPTSAEPAR
jgi:chemotaxis protein MotB